jgi:hypothetical protein
MTIVRRFAFAMLVAVLTVQAAVTGAQPAAKTPSEAYLGYRAALLKAKSLDDLRPWFSKDGVAKLGSLPADQKGMMLEMIKDLSSAITNVKVVGEDIKGDTATLRVEGTDSGDKSTKKASVDIVREGGTWKFVKENWGGQ